jgi:esterase/lipase superfamily enzyme
MTQKTIDGVRYAGFASWEDVQAAVSRGVRLYYHAPMDYRPARVTCVLKKTNKVRVLPPTSDADPFTADVRHLDRFFIRLEA